LGDVGTWGRRYGCPDDAHHGKGMLENTKGIGLPIPFNAVPTSPRPPSLEMCSGRHVYTSWLLTAISIFSSLCFSVTRILKNSLPPTKMTPGKLFLWRRLAKSRDDSLSYIGCLHGHYLVNSKRGLSSFPRDRVHLNQARHNSLTRFKLLSLVSSITDLRAIPVLWYTSCNAPDPRTAPGAFAQEKPR